MSETRSITCDGCGKPIVGIPGYPRNDYLLLSVGQAPTPPSDVVFGLHQTPMLDGDKHFHSATCLSLWLNGIIKVDLSPASDSTSDGSVSWGTKPKVYSSMAQGMRIRSGDPSA